MEDASSIFDFPSSLHSMTELSELPSRSEWRLLISGPGSNNGGGQSLGVAKWERKETSYLELSPASLLPVDFYSIRTFFFSVMEHRGTMKKSNRAINIVYPGNPAEGLK